MLRTGDADCSTALAKAAANGDVAMLSLLLEWGEDVEIRPPGESGREAGYTGLHAAAKHGQLEAAAFLLGRGADVNARCVGGQTPLMLSAKWADTRLAGLLLRHGTDVGLRDAQGSTALQHAAETSSDLVRLLREHGAEADTRDRKRRGRPLSGP